MAFSGAYGLIAFKQKNADTYDVLDLSYVFKESYKVSPEKRQDLDSVRDSNGYLKRNVLAHTASTIEFAVKSLDETQLANLTSFIRNHYQIASEKKVNLRYFNPLQNSYNTGDFYIPDIDFTIANVDLAKSKIRYNQFTLKFIEY